MSGGQDNGSVQGISASVLEQINARLGEIREDVRDLKTHVDDKLDKFAADYVTKTLLQALLKPYEDSIKSLEEDRKKLVWMVVGAVIIALLALVTTGVDGANK